jgi:hypothetical protein
LGIEQYEPRKLPPKSDERDQKISDADIGLSIFKIYGRTQKQKKNGADKRRQRIRAQRKSIHIG